QTISKMLEPRRIGSIHCWKISPLGLAWMYLALAVVSEVCGLTLMKLSVSTGRVEGFVAFYLLVALSYVFLAKAVQSISMGMAYAVWEGSGVALITVVSAFMFHQFLSIAEWVGLLMAVAGVWMIHAGEVHDG
ncbi:MAG: multidrug efflux SMR transporter, partial [Pirellula sp.]